MIAQGLVVDLTCGLCLEQLQDVLVLLVGLDVSYKFFIMLQKSA